MFNSLNYKIQFSDSDFFYELSLLLFFFYYVFIVLFLHVEMRYGYGTILTSESEDIERTYMVTPTSTGGPANILRPQK